ncbi:AMP nucleosidase, partial [Salmonella enterica subsp. enterica serovar Heidelberg str. RI-11-013343]
QGYRFRVPYGTLLCVSDKPLHGELNCPGRQTGFMRGLFQNICKSVFVLLIYYAQKVIVCTHVNYARLMSHRFANEMSCRLLLDRSGRGVFM